jgi:Fe-S cluster assembly protein SufD
MNTTSDYYRTALEATLEQDADAGYPRWVKQARSAALEKFLDEGFPHVKLENWRYTNLAPMAERIIGAIAKPVRGAEPHLPPSDADAITLVFVNGLFSAKRSSRKSLPAGVVVANLASQLENEESDSLLSVAPGNSSLAQLNSAMVSDGAVLRVPDNTELPHAVHIVYSNTAAANVFPRVTVQLGRNAKATVIEHHLSSGASASTAVTNLECAEGAQLRYQKLQEESPESYHVAVQNVSLAKDARCDIVNIDLGGAIGRNDLRILLQGSGAEAHINSLFLVDGVRHTDNHLHLEHQAPNTSSRAHYAGVVANKGRGVFNGMIHVTQAAQKTDAALYNKNLLLTEGAEIDTKPELEIYADDVKCAHGSTTGQLDAASLFYMRTRGVPEQVARNMLVQAFATEVVQQLATEALRDYVLNSVEQRLNELGAVVEA